MTLLAALERVIAEFDEAVQCAEVGNFGPLDDVRGSLDGLRPELLAALKAAEMAPMLYEALLEARGILDGEPRTGEAILQIDQAIGAREMTMRAPSIAASRGGEVGDGN
jgi:hypothetical protein